MEIKARYFMIIIVLAVLFLLFLEIPFGKTIYITKENNTVLEIPNFTKFKGEKTNEVKFTSIKSKWALQKDINKILDRYQKIACDNTTYYYNEEKDYTISKYVINKKWLNEITITYALGNTCDVDTSMKKIELIPDDFTIEEAKEAGYFVVTNDSYFNKEYYDEFSNNANEGNNSVLRIITTTSEGDLIITDLHYENKKFRVVRDETRDRNSQDEFIMAYNFEKIGIYKNKLYAYNGAKLNSSVINSKNALYLFDIYE